MNLKPTRLLVQVSAWMVSEKGSFCYLRVQRVLIQMEIAMQSCVQQHDYLQPFCRNTLQTCTSLHF